MDQITSRPIVIGIDAGGTMTDTILVDQDGHFKIGKSATTPKNEAEGFLASAEDAADAWGISLEDLFSGVNVVLYSGTGMLNTLLSRTGRKLGLITTKGLEDMVLMGRGLQAWADYSYADRLHAVTHAHPEPLVPRRRTHGVTERIDQFGDIILPLYEHEVRTAAQKLIADKVDAICIMTVFSHVNPAHEKRIAEICREEIAAAGADILIYTSHEVRPVIREQSRLNSVLIEAYATSRGRKQLKGIEDISKKYGFRYGVQTLLSFGGLTSINHPRLHETMISGPIGGILGAAYVGKLIGNDSLICSDMGGTSFDMGVITRGQTRIENEPLIRIANCFGTSISELFTGADTGQDPVLRRAQRPALPLMNGQRKMLLSRRPLTHFETYIAEFEVGGSSGDEAYTHGDSHEMILVLRGQVRLDLGASSHSLDEGDSVEYATSTPHRVVNTGNGPAEVLFMISPPTSTATYLDEFRQKRS